LYFGISFPFILVYRSFVFLLRLKKYAWRTQITENLFLGGYYFFPWDFYFLSQNHIDIAINLCKELPPLEFLFLKQKVKYFHIPVWDTKSISEEQYLPLKEYLQKNPQKRILITCALGQSRSASLLCKLLHDVYGYSLKDALALVSLKRNISFSPVQKKFVGI
jgi:protein-tyrosine phosphatase